MSSRIFLLFFSSQNKPVFLKKNCRPWLSPPSSLPLKYNAPAPGWSPKVLRFLCAMERAGWDAFLDVHGNEALPFNFLAGSEGIPLWGRRLEALLGGE